MVSKVFEKLVNNRIVAFFVISSMVLDFLNQLQVFWQLYLRIARAFNRFGATCPVVLISKASDRVWHAGLFHKYVMEFHVRYLALFCLFSVIDSFKSIWMESLHKNIQLMLEFLKAPFLVLHFSYYTLMAFLMMLQSNLFK